LTGATLSGTVLSLLAIVYGSSASWCTMASDYYVHYPATVSRVKVFLMTTFGIAIPTSIGMVAGCVVASALNNKPTWHSTYEDEGLGFLIQDMLHPRGFAKLLLTLLVLSGINTNIISIYSSAISCQQFSRPFARIPRFIWTFVCFAAIIGLALGGREQLNTYLSNFLSLLGYWCTSYFVILFTEHVVFRKGRFENYDLEGWNDPARLPHGIGAFVAFALGVVAWVSHPFLLALLFFAFSLRPHVGPLANEFLSVMPSSPRMPSQAPLMPMVVPIGHGYGRNMVRRPFRQIDRRLWRRRRK
jgi:purine-cytosine permease-like protein